MDKLGFFSNIQILLVYCIQWIITVYLNSVIDNVNRWKIILILAQCQGYKRLYKWFTIEQKMTKLCKKTKKYAKYVFNS